MNLRDVNDDELVEELERRKRIRNIVPSIKENIDWSKMIQLACQNIVVIHDDGYEIKDIEHWAYECLMKTVFGDDVFRWVNENT